MHLVTREAGQLVPSEEPATARPADPKLYAVWRDRVRRQQPSGLTISQICTQESVAMSEFHSWKRRFQLMDSPAQCQALPAQRTFVPVTIRLDERTVDSGEPELPIEAELPNGIRLRIPTVNARFACRLVRSIAGQTKGDKQRGT